MNRASTRQFLKIGLPFPNRSRPLPLTQHRDSPQPGCALPPQSLPLNYDAHLGGPGKPVHTRRQDQSNEYAVAANPAVTGRCLIKGELLEKARRARQYKQREAMTDYRAIVDQLTKHHGIRVHRWRTDTSGCAWRTWDEDGQTVKWIEVPEPTSVLSLAICLHEIGHHIKGLDSYHLRCQAEYDAWKWSFEHLEKLGIHPDRDVYERYDLSIRYAVFKDMRRGAQNLPPELAAFTPQAA